jgi:hypothetical protein
VDAAPSAAPILSLGVNRPAISPPSAMMQAPVSVATSTMALTPAFSWAYHIASASVSRPSASVLFTSIVLPLAAVRMSPGRSPLPLTMFSQLAMMKCTWRAGGEGWGWGRRVAELAQQRERSRAARVAAMHLEGALERGGGGRGGSRAAAGSSPSACPSGPSGLAGPAALQRSSLAAGSQQQVAAGLTSTSAGCVAPMMAAAPRVAAAPPMSNFISSIMEPAPAFRL